MITSALLLISAVRDAAMVGLAMVGISAAVFLAAFRKRPGQRGADLRLVILAIALFFAGGIVLIFGIVNREVAKGIPGS